MAFNENIANRVAEILIELKILFEERKMFGGMAYMVNHRMCICVIKDDLMVRVLDNKYEELLDENFVRPMDFTGKPMKGFLFIEEDGFKTTIELKKWINQGLEFSEFGELKSKKIKLKLV